MEGVRIRPLLPADMEQMYRIHLTRDDVTHPDDARKRTRLLEWMAFHNPCAGGEPTYYIAEHEGVVAAFQGRMPLEFVIAGKRRKGYYVHDTYVHPEYRAKGWGFSLITSLAQRSEEESDAFFSLIGGTRLNLKIQRRMGYLELPEAPQFIKVLNPRKQLAKRVKSRLAVRTLTPLATAILSAADTAILTLRAGNRKLSAPERFDERFDALLERITPSLRMCPAKTSAYLNWRYVDRPFRRDSIIAAEADGTITGFAVLSLNPYKPEYPIGIVLDISADPRDHETLAALCAGAVRYFRQTHVEAISLVITDADIEAVFQKFGFRKDSTGKAFLLGNLTKAGSDAAQMKEIRNWHISRGDSDGFMLSP
jgi:GNAT superfamily N-acetyltransferase